MSWWLVRDIFFSSLLIIFFTLYPFYIMLMNTRMFNINSLSDKGYAPVGAR
jgi:hypothetical protein